jgi:hypothetical protein
MFHSVSKLLKKELVSNTIFSDLPFAVRRSKFAAAGFMDSGLS